MIATCACCRGYDKATGFALEACVNADKVFSFLHGLLSAESQNAHVSSPLDFARDDALVLCACARLSARENLVLSAHELAKQFRILHRNFLQLFSAHYAFCRIFSLLFWIHSDLKWDIFDSNFFVCDWACWRLLLLFLRYWLA